MKKSHCRAERGQSLVELALSLPLILLILSGLLDLGRLYYIHIALEDSAAEAAMYLAINPTCPTAVSGPNCADPNNAEYRGRHSGTGHTESTFHIVSWQSVTYYFDGPPAVWGVGETVKVRLEYPYRLLTPIISRITDEPLTLYSSADAVILREE